MTTLTRLEELPDVPAVDEVVPGYEASSWYGLGAPRNTSAAVIDKLNNAVNAALADPAMKARFRDLGGIVMGGSPADLATLMAQESGKWIRVIRTANIKPD